MNKILIIEDENKIARFVSLELEHEGYQTTISNDGREGLELALENEYDLIVLDIMLPSLNGIEVLRRLRLTKNTPVIILTARDQVMDKVSGLDIGANDYMTKPFAIEELLARIRVHMKEVDKGNIIEFQNIVIDKDTFTIKIAGEKVELTKKEFDLLVFMLEHRNIVITREQALDAVWGFDFYGNTNVVDVYVRYLRSKIDDVFDIKVIQTVRGAGYIVRD